MRKKYLKHFDVTYVLEFFFGFLVDRPLVTATHAIFFEEKGHKAPVAVVGIQFHHQSLASHFVNVTSTVNYI